MQIFLWLHIIAIYIARSRVNDHNKNYDYIQAWRLSFYIKIFRKSRISGNLVGLSLFIEKMEPHSDSKCTWQMQILHPPKMIHVCIITFKT